MSLDEQLPIVNAFPSIADGSSFSMVAEDDAVVTLYRRIEEASARELVRPIFWW